MRPGNYTLLLEDAKNDLGGLEEGGGAKENVFVVKEAKVLREPYSQAVRIILNKYYKL
jgi:hypothetical protein